MLFYRFILDTLVHLLPLAGAITTAHISLWNYDVIHEGKIWLEWRKNSLSMMVHQRWQLIGMDMTNYSTLH